MCLGRDGKAWNRWVGTRMSYYHQVGQVGVVCGSLVVVGKAEVDVVGRTGWMD